MAEPTTNAQHSLMQAASTEAADAMSDIKQMKVQLAAQHELLTTKHWGGMSRNAFDRAWQLWNTEMDTILAALTEFSANLAKSEKHYVQAQHDTAGAASRLSANINA